jgi:cell division protein FtsB
VWVVPDVSSVERLSAENAVLRAENAGLRDENVALRAELDELKNVFAVMVDRVAELESQLGSDAPGSCGSCLENPQYREALRLQCRRHGWTTREA